MEILFISRVTIRSVFQNPVTINVGAVQVQCCVPTLLFCAIKLVRMNLPRPAYMLLVV